MRKRKGHGRVGTSEVETNYLIQEKEKEQVDVSRTDSNLNDFTSKLLEVPRLTIFHSILLKRSSGDLGETHFELHELQDWLSTW